MTSSRYIKSECDFSAPDDVTHLSPLKMDLDPFSILKRQG